MCVSYKWFYFNIYRRALDVSGVSVVVGAHDQGSPEDETTSTVHPVSMIIEHERKPKCSFFI